MSTSSRSKLPIFGVIVALVGVAAAAALWFLASSQVADAAKSLAPAPVDCDTALDFEDAGTYLIYAETTGEVGELDGDCANDDQSYEGSDTNLDITMFDSDENEVGLRRDSDGPSYDAGGRKGVLLYRVEIEEPGEFTLRVQGDDAEVVARVGKNPNDGAGVLRMGAIGALIAGLLLGALLILLGRRGGTGGTAATSGWQPAYQPYGAAPPYQPGPTGPSGPAGQPAPPGGGWQTPPSAPPGQPGQPGGGWGERPQEPPPPPPPPWNPPSR